MSSTAALCDSGLFVQTTQLDAALNLLDHESVGLDVRMVCITEPRIQGAPKPNKVYDNVFVQLVSKCPNIRTLLLRSWYFAFVRPHLLSQCSFSSLSSLAIGWHSSLSVAGFFGLLSVMPALKKLVLGSIANYDDSSRSSNSSTAGNDDEDLPAPACSLTHLGVCDDWDIDFMHYPLLLSRSHDTLEHLDLQWIYREDIADVVLRALALCTRVRHLSLIGNDFPNARIISACPSASSLTLTEAPSEAEWAALRAPLRALELAKCTPVEPGEYVARAWELLKDRVPQTPMLREIRFNFMGLALLRETDEYREMRRVCRDRRIHLALCGPRDSLWI